MSDILDEHARPTAISNSWDRNAPPPARVLSGAFVSGGVCTSRSAIEPVSEGEPLAFGLVLTLTAVVAL